MRQCSSCDSIQIVEISAKCSDLFYVKWWDYIVDNKVKAGREQNGYVPKVLGLGNDSDYVEFDYCFYCGQIQDFKAGEADEI